MFKKIFWKTFRQNFIKIKFFFVASFVFIVRKSKNDLQFYVDYRQLNIMIIKNKYSLFLIKKFWNAFVKSTKSISSSFSIVCECNKKNEKSFSKFDMIYINISLCFSISSFQNFINDVLQKMFDNFCVVYIDDILIYNNF